ncbi:MAG: efflux RND transporter periplasmic adaptor subunit, partial [Longimicrobiales bacterium]
MKRKKVWLPVGVMAASFTVWAFVGRDAADAEAYRFAAVERGSIESVVTSTGAIEALETVEVGTQVSGQIAELFVDFNDRVEKSQLLARIDPTLLRQEVRSAEASLMRSRADLEQAERELNRARELHESRVMTTSELETAEYQRTVAQASFASAEVALERAKRNLAYTEIHAPIDGVVVERTVDVGQTVAASMSAPVLFLIARDLSEMRILADVDESDIGKIRDGQEVRFTVQAYGDETFTGGVEQVRLQSTTQENVVSYHVV